MVVSLRRPGVLAFGLTALQALDLLLTRLLVGGWRHHDVVEANPLALSVLTRHGWVGLAAFKLGCSLVAIACALAVYRFRPVTGVRLLGVMCLTMLAVVGYSTALLARPPSDDHHELAKAAERSRRLDEGRVRSQAFLSWREQTCRALLEGRVGLPEAVEEMGHHQATLRAGRSGACPRWVADADDPGERAAHLLAYALRMVHFDQRLPTARLEALLDECHQRFGKVVAHDPTLARR